jgi:hypothetical protein
MFTWTRNLLLNSCHVLPDPLNLQMRKILITFQAPVAWAGLSHQSATREITAIEKSTTLHNMHNTWGYRHRTLKPAMVTRITAQTLKLHSLGIEKANTAHEKEVPLSRVSNRHTLLQVNICWWTKVCKVVTVAKKMKHTRKSLIILLV